MLLICAMPAGMAAAAAAARCCTGDISVAGPAAVIQHTSHLCIVRGWRFPAGTRSCSREAETSGSCTQHAAAACTAALHCCCTALLHALLLLMQREPVCAGSYGTSHWLEVRRQQQKQSKREAAGKIFNNPGSIEVLQAPAWVSFSHLSGSLLGYIMHSTTCTEPNTAPTCSMQQNTQTASAPRHLRNSINRSAQEVATKARTVRPSSAANGAAMRCTCLPL